MSFDHCDYRALHRAVKAPSSDLGEIDRLATAAAAAGELDACNLRRLTPLHLAVITDRADVSRLLVSHGASLRLHEQRYGDTVLHLACRLGCGSCLHEIIDASSTARKQDIKTILHSANSEGTGTYIYVNVNMYV